MANLSHPPKFVTMEAFQNIYIIARIQGCHYSGKPGKVMEFTLVWKIHEKKHKSLEKVLKVLEN